MKIIRRNSITWFLIIIICIICLLQIIYKFPNNDSNRKNSNHHTQLIELVNLGELTSDNRKSVVPKYDNLMIKDIYDSNFENSLLNYTKQDNFIIELSSNRINKLFSILKEKESQYSDILKQLDVISFNDLLSTSENNKFNLDKLSSNIYKKFNKEIETYLEIKDNQIVATNALYKQLKYISHYYSYYNQRNSVTPKEISKNNKAVIVTAANTHYYGSLQATIFYVHKYFPEHKIIVYDLGLSSIMIEATKKKCKCEVRKYNSDGIYSKISDHFSDLKSYAWKPVIIQEVLKEHDSIMYMDSSVRFHNGQLEPLFSVLEIVGLLTQFIGLKLTCYTNPKMFEWFQESASSYEGMNTIEANYIMMHQNFLNALIMKAWVTCALDKSCIAPEGSTIGGCCGCHRYDQDAIAIISTFFYGHPTSKSNLPAYSFTKNESFFFSIQRYTGMSYFK